MPLVVGVGIDIGAHHAVVQVLDDCVRLHSSRRTHVSQKTVLTRKCWCKQCPLTCPVHVLGPYFSEFQCGVKPFAEFSAGMALTRLRYTLSLLGVLDAVKYRTHDLRRGHARDLQENGASLGEILAAGQWRSPAFLSYLDPDELEGGAVVEAHMEESSDSECEGLVA